MKNFRPLITVFILAVLLAGCATPTVTPMVTFPLETVLPTATQAPTQTQPPVVTATPESTPTTTPLAEVAGSIPIIEYHDPDFKMSDSVQMTPEWFEEQLQWLYENGYTTLTAEQMAEFVEGSAVFPARSVVISFDIGVAKKPIYRDVVVPTLKKYGFTAVVFLLTNTSVLGDDCSQELKFCWDDFKQWEAEGVFSVSSHGVMHPDYTKLTSAEMLNDLNQSSALIEMNLGHKPVAFAFPYDSYPKNAAAVLKSAGYRFGAAGNVRPDLSSHAFDASWYALPRVYPYSNPTIYPAIVSGAGASFGEYISKFEQPVPVSALAPTQTAIAAARVSATAKPQASATPAQGETPLAKIEVTPEPQTNVDQVYAFCASLPSVEPYRTNAFLTASFTSDISPMAQLGLPAVITSPSCNFHGEDHPEVIVVHYTDGGLSGTLNEFHKHNGASSHYVIDRDGTVYQMVPETLAALHVNCNGVRSNCLASCTICDGSDGKLTEPYTRSIGIEIVNDGRINPDGYAGPVYEDYLKSFGYRYWEDYTEAQIQSLKVLVEDIAERWGIPVDEQHVIGHYLINQKIDPGPALNLFWARPGNPPREAIFSSEP